MVVYRKQCPISGVYLKQTNVVCDTVGRCQPSRKAVVVLSTEKLGEDGSKQITAAETT
jgi:hypothetical protein